jgi:hypothetical protein
MIELVSTTIAISVFFIVVCGGYCLKEKYYRDNYYNTKPYYHYQQPLNDSNYLERI